MIDIALRLTVTVVAVPETSNLDRLDVESVTNIPYWFCGNHPGTLLPVAFLTTVLTIFRKLLCDIKCHKRTCHFTLLFLELPVLNGIVGDVGRFT